ncbi:bacteriohemerythrin [Magnetospira sp. QH-2]|uniref:bacteriohemerythrin n=1 Tax=Magnetospira sp. (strain QH-2) TaxID=1288970 RepID=UPI0003E815FE|nr:hemerythrin domain-containing protein [Magnetospira sp. QH-2]CCQ74314.1 Protein of unknown function [Magnetospira sp. QH-2]
MSHLEWDKNWETGHPLIDFDHRTLVELANRLRELLHQAPDLSAIDHFMVRLSDLVHKHLPREEEILRLSNFPDLLEHMKEHQIIADRFRHVSDIWHRDPDNLILDHVLAFVDDWLELHTRHEFGPLSEHLATQT